MCVYLPYTGKYIYIYMCVYFPLYSHTQHLTSMRQQVSVYYRPSSGHLL